MPTEPHPIIDGRRAPVYRLIFALAAAYGIGFVLWATLTPNSFFDLFQLARPRSSALWSTLGIVLGLYGVAYAYSGWRLDRARPFIAIGLAGKILVPIGWVLAVHGGHLPARTFALIALDDIVWWLPFALFLLEGSALGRRIRDTAPYACALINLVAAAVLAVVLGPVLTVGDLQTRAAFVVDHSLIWRLGWGIWIAAALSLVAFYAWWGARIASPELALVALAVAIVGLTFDTAAESLFIGWLPRDFDRIAQTATVLTGGMANGLYTIAGVLLTLGTGSFRGRFLLWTWAVWTAGILVSAFSFAGHLSGIALSTAALFILFCPWAATMRLQLR